MPQQKQKICTGQEGNASGAKEAAEKVPFGGEDVPQRLKPDSLQSIYARPEGRTLQNMSFSESSKAQFFSDLYGPTKVVP
jgi:hypothetical protein